MAGCLTQLCGGLRYCEVPRKVFVFKGTWKLSAVDSPWTRGAQFAGIEIYENEIRQQAARASVGEKSAFAGAIGKFLGEQILIESNEFPRLFWYYNMSPEHPPQNREAVLNDIGAEMVRGDPHGPPAVH